MTILANGSEFLKDGDSRLVIGNRSTFRSKSTKAVTTVSSEVLDLRLRRATAFLQNLGNIDAWLGFGEDAVAGVGMFLPRGTVLTIDWSFQYVGQITAATSFGSTTIEVVDFDDALI